jgi:hypothetical protein
MLSSNLFMGAGLASNKKEKGVGFSWVSILRAFDRA